MTRDDGLGDCFVLTNPRLRVSDAKFVKTHRYQLDILYQDHPIILVSDGFNAVTGYPRDQIIGRNCRFLQGPGTTPEAVKRIRQGIDSGEGEHDRPDMKTW